MPPPIKPTVKIKITTRFADEHGGQLFGPGVWDVDPATSMRLIANGKATLVGAETVSKPGPNSKELRPPLAPGEKALTPASNPRIPPVAPPPAVEPIPLPEKFPSREVLISAGIDSVQKLQEPNVKETLAGVTGLTLADITKIGLAISKV